MKRKSRRSSHEADSELFGRAVAQEYQAPNVLLVLAPQISSLELAVKSGLIRPSPEQRNSEALASAIPIACGIKRATPPNLRQRLQEADPGSGGWGQHDIHTTCHCCLGLTTSEPLHVNSPMLYCKH